MIPTCDEAEARAAERSLPDAVRRAETRLWHRSMQNRSGNFKTSFAVGSPSRSSSE